MADTCPQTAFVQFHCIFREEMGLPENETVFYGMSLGYGNRDAPENALRIERASLTEWVQFKDGSTCYTLGRADSKKMDAP